MGGLTVKQTLRTLFLAACCLTLVLAGQLPAWAQQSTGTITGFVLDPSGAAITGVTVVARDVDRGLTWTSVTNNVGLYNLPNVSIGNIEVKVAAKGFAPQTHSAFALVVNQVASIDFQLKVGSGTETVEVTSDPPLLQTGSSEISFLLPANAVSTLPMAARNTNQLTLLAPGVVSPNIFAFEGAQTTFGTGRPYVNGAREQDNNFTLDGMDVNQADNNDVAYVISPDAVDNINIMTSNAPADFGNYIGGVVVMTTKSGTNQFHGTVSEYFRNTGLNANSWQDKANGALVGIPGAAVLPRPVLHWNNFGGAVGGPILHNKLFFFGDFSGMINSTPKTAETNSSIPSTQLGFLTGDFSVVCTSLGATFVDGVCSNPAGQLYQPTAGVSPGARQPFANNQVPINSAVAQKLIASPYFTAQEEQQTYYTTSYIHAWQGDGKIDWQPTQNDHVMGRYSQAYTINNTTNGTDVLTPDLTREYPLKNFVIAYDRVLSPTVVNELRLGGQIFPANDQIYSNPIGGNLPSEFGLPGVQGDILPSISFGFQTIGSTNSVEIFHDHTIEIEDSLTWTQGHHQVRAGFEFYHYIMNDWYSGNSGSSGSFTFTGQFTGNGGSEGGSLGAPFADFLLGLPQEVQVGSPLNFHLRNSQFASFITDTYQATPTLNLTLGLRYERISARGDKDSRKNVNYDFYTGQPEIGINYNTYDGITNFQPRFGFAWTPAFAPHTVLRGAYDISGYMEGNGVNNMAVMNPPLNIATDLKNALGSDLPETTLDQGYSTFSSACTAVQLEAYAPNCISGVQAHATDPNLRPAVDQQWNLVAEHQFPHALTASLGYVGNKIDHLSDIYLYNQKVLNSAGVAVPGPYMTQLIANGVGQARYNGSDGFSTYNALQVTVAQQNYHGLDYHLSYSWSKCLTNTLGYFGSYGDEEGIGESQTQATQNFFQNEYDPKADYGRCTTDVASYFTGYVLYQLPIGRGKLLGTDVPRAVDEVIGGWQASGDISLHSGFGITPFAGSYMGDNNSLSASGLTGSYEPRPDCVAGVSGGQSMQTVQIGGSIGKVNLNPAAVTTTQDGQWGTCSNGQFRGPGLKTADLSLIKRFPITEKTNLAFAAQFINLTNTPIFSVPASWWGQYSSCVSCNGVRTTGPDGGLAGTTGLYGLLDGSNPGRQVELSLRFSF
jgi:hypothetical protein